MKRQMSTEINSLQNVQDSSGCETSRRTRLIVIFLGHRDEAINLEISLKKIIRLHICKVILHTILEVGQCCV